jgi:hypothetical protein
MITWLQKYHRVLLIVVFFTAAVGLVSLYNPATDLEAMRSGSANRVATIYGRNIDVEAYQRYLRLLSLSQELGMYEYLSAMMGDRTGRMDRDDQFIYNTIVLREEAERLQLNPTQEEMVAALQELPYFQTDGRFDVAKLNTFLQDSLASRGFTQSQLDDIVKDSLRLKKLQKMLAGTVPPPDAEAKRYFDLGNQRTLIQAVKLTTQEFASQVQPTEDEIAKHYELNQAKYLTEEKRRVEYVVFKTNLPAKADETKDPADAVKPATPATPTDDEKRAKVKAQQESSQKATDFVIAVTQDASADAYKNKAAALGLEIKSTPLYNSGDFVKELRDLSPNAFRAAQQLTKEVPVSDAVSAVDDFAVLHLVEIVPSARKTLEEAKPLVIEELKVKLGKEKMEARLEELRKLFQEGLTAGKSFEDLAKEQKVTLITPPPFRPMDPPREMVDDIADLIETAVYLKTGSISQRVDVADGSLLVYVKQRETASADVWMTEKENTTNRLQEALQMQFLANWFSTSREAAKLTTYAAASSAAKRG